MVYHEIYVPPGEEKKSNQKSVNTLHTASTHTGPWDSQQKYISQETIRRSAPLEPVLESVAEPVQEEAPVVQVCSSLTSNNLKLRGSQAMRNSTGSNNVNNVMNSFATISNLCNSRLPYDSLEYSRDHGIENDHINAVSGDFSQLLGSNVLASSVHSVQSKDMINDANFQPADSCSATGGCIGATSAGSHHCGDAVSDSIPNPKMAPLLNKPPKMPGAAGGMAGLGAAVFDTPSPYEEKWVDSRPRCTGGVQAQPSSTDSSQKGYACGGGGVEPLTLFQSSNHSSPQVTPSNECVLNPASSCNDTSNKKSLRLPLQPQVQFEISSTNEHIQKTLSTTTKYKLSLVNTLFMVAA
jgi:hypothetical protein